jgi:hypothetical protein
MTLVVTKPWFGYRKGRDLVVGRLQDVKVTKGLIHLRITFSSGSLLYDNEPSGLSQS